MCGQSITRIMRWSYRYVMLLIWRRVLELAQHPSLHHQSVYSWETSEIPMILRVLRSHLQMKSEGSEFSLRICAQDQNSKETVTKISLIFKTASSYCGTKKWIAEHFFWTNEIFWALCQHSGFLYLYTGWNDIHVRH